MYTRWGWRDPMTGRWCRHVAMVPCEPRNATARNFHHFVMHRTPKTER